MQVTIILSHQPRDFDFLIPSTWGDEVDAILTNEGAGASYGLPIVLLEGKAYGPGDLKNPFVRTEDPSVARIALTGGWAVKSDTLCQRCGSPLRPDELGNIGYHRHLHATYPADAPALNACEEYARYGISDGRPDDIDDIVL